MCPIGLIVEYSRKNVPSLSSGCEIAHFFVRYMAWRTAAPSCAHRIATSPACHPNVHVRLKGWFGLPKSSFGGLNGEHESVDDMLYH
jgi:hypothetical protein